MLAWRRGRALAPAAGGQPTYGHDALLMEDTGGEQPRASLSSPSCRSPWCPCSCASMMWRCLDQVCGWPDNGYSPIIIPAFGGAFRCMRCRAQASRDIVHRAGRWLRQAAIWMTWRATPQVVLGSGPTSMPSGGGDDRALLSDVRLPCPHRHPQRHGAGRRGQPAFRRETGFGVGPHGERRAAQPGGVSAGPWATGACRWWRGLRRASVNVSIKAIDGEAGRVDFYAPVFDDRGIPPGGAGGFLGAPLEQGMEPALWSCNCILNYAYWHLEGQAAYGTPPGTSFARSPTCRSTRPRCARVSGRAGAGRAERAGSRRGWRAGPRLQWMRGAGTPR